MNITGAVKRKRTQNYTAEEKMLFVRTLQDMGHILISKVTSHDASTNKEKEAVWEKITNHLNASGSIRYVDSYKKLWAKLKSEAKTYKSKALHQVQGTGGGPSQIKSDPVLDAVIEITGRGSTGIKRILDADTFVNDDHMIQKDDVEASIPSEFIIQSDTLECELTEEKETLQESNTENQKTPANYYKRRRPMLNHSNERTSLQAKKIADIKLMVEEQKLELLKQQEIYMKEQHEIKMENDKKLQLVKESILEEIRKKIRDGEKVDSEILKSMF